SLAMKQSASSPYVSSAYARVPPPPSFNSSVVTPVNYTESYEPAPSPADASYAGFYDALAPYGSWVDVDGYGRCWQPTVEVADPNWQPYLDCGRWVYTDCGWYWMSD